MTTTQLPSTARTIAALVAFGIAGSGMAAPALAATTPAKPKTVAVKATQYPRLIDNPGTTDDKVRFTNVPGADWKLDGNPVAFDSGKSTRDMPVTAASKATLAAVSGDDITWALPETMPTAWNYPAPSAAPAPPVNVDAITAIFNDVPGTKDTVTISKVAGVTWTVATGSEIKVYDAAAFGTKTSLTLPVTAASTVVADLDDVYAGSGAVPTFTNSVTDDATVTFTQAQLDAMIEVGENPHDRIKGFGPGAAAETVKVLGVPGVKWKVGTLPAKAVKGVGYLPVDPDDIKAGKVTVTAEVLKGYALPSGYVAPQLNFSDSATIPTITITDTDNVDVKNTDRGGIANDTIVLTPQQGMVWWVGQADARGKIAYKAQKPGKDGKIVYKVKHASKAPTTGSTDATVHIKPVPNRGYVLDLTAFTKQSYDFTRADSVVDADNYVTTGNVVTFKPIQGVSSWAVKYNVTVGTKTSAKSHTVKPTDMTATGATTVEVTFPSAPTVTPKLLKNYTLAPVTP